MYNEFDFFFKSCTSSKKLRAININLPNNPVMLIREGGNDDRTILENPESNFFYVKKICEYSGQSSKITLDENARAF